MGPERERTAQWGGLITGLVIVTAGVIFWLDQLGRIEARDYIRWWPVALIAIGLGHLLQRRLVASAFWIGFGTLFLVEKVWRGFDIGDVLGLWPLAISIGGIALVAQAVRPAPKDLARPRSGAKFNAVAVMAGNVRTVTSRDFIGGDVVAVMGGCEIDLTGAQISGGEAVLDVVTFWGGIELFVPPTWTVVWKGLPILGSYEDHNAPPSQPGPRLIIRGAVIMAGIEVRSSRKAPESQS